MISSILFSVLVFAADDTAKWQAAAVKMVPGAKVVKIEGREFDLQTTKDTLVEVEVNSDGSIDEASGKAALGGDLFVPGKGHINLETAVATLKKAGKNPSGSWSFKKSVLSGWIYEFDGIEAGKEMEYDISAKDGKLLKSRQDH